MAFDRPEERSEAEQGEVLPRTQVLDYLQSLAQAFRPAAPIDSRALFAGRSAQVQAIFGVAAQPGQHAVIYGERGVGKTSLATVAAEVIGKQPAITARVNCDTGDDFSSVWLKAFEQIHVLAETPALGFASEARQAMSTAVSLLRGDSISPEDVRRVLRTLTSDLPVIVFIDEFDRLPHNGAQTLFADSVKTLSDQLVRATIIVVGVADDVSELIAEHQSIERALVQVHIPRMSQNELAEIVTRGTEAAQMTIGPDSVGRIAQLSQGLPHYTHLLGQLAGQAAVDDLTTRVALEHVNRAVELAISNAQHSIMDAYVRATTSPRQTLYPQVLLACALAHGDDFGFFAAADVREPLTRIMGSRYDIPTFARHLKELSGPGRGPVLQKKGPTRRVRYRFLNPLLQPYVIMRGLTAGLIEPEDLERQPG